MSTRNWFHTTFDLFVVATLLSIGDLGLSRLVLFLLWFITPFSSCSLTPDIMCLMKSILWYIEYCLRSSGRSKSVGSSKNVLVARLGVKTNGYVDRKTDIRSWTLARPSRSCLVSLVVYFLYVLAVFDVCLSPFNVLRCVFHDADRLAIYKAWL